MVNVEFEGNEDCIILLKNSILSPRITVVHGNAKRYSHRQAMNETDTLDIIIDIMVMNKDVGETGLDRNTTPIITEPNAVDRRIDRDADSL